MQDELLLLHRAKSYDQDALAQVHEQYYGAIYRYMTFRVNDLQTAEDLTSEVFVRFLHAIQQKNAPQKTIRGWLFGTASLILKEHYRKKKRSQLTELTEALPGETAVPTEKLEVQESKEALRQAMANLTEEQRQVLALRFGYEMPVRDVAETMNKSEGSVKMLQMRAIAALTRTMTGSERRE
ncbi:sigma-70 family RNA polymerase sigma factor [Candidatus Leptofilum sp.]|uniref:sigma-70 family RNA polymerase sigma factor n=1 Tax=Candidatus Leptofilum sp. TaxID=3241576 RepID=UPI003B5B8B86